MLDARFYNDTFNSLISSTTSLYWSGHPSITSIIFSQNFFESINSYYNINFSFINHIEALVSKNAWGKSL